MDAAFFHCKDCVRLTANRQRTKGHIKFINGDIEVREGRHYPTCRAYEIKEIPKALPENERPDDIVVVGDIDMQDVEEPSPIVKYDFNKTLR
uniref:Uncharacterized protein n=1 Tax=Panagrolaimus superbus TaxID=310955 RepID=A0A914YK73_9BILA